MLKAPLTAKSAANKAISVMLRTEVIVLFMHHFSLIQKSFRF
jgi:hypothetical protein